MFDRDKKIGILWDMDGVIVDSGEPHFISWQKALQLNGLSCTREFFEKTFGMNNRGILSLIMGREATDQEVESIGDLKEELFRRDVQGRLEPLPGVLDWLERFSQAGFPQAVASSAPWENIDAVVTELDITKWFQALVSGSSLKGKPDPATFLLAAQKLGMEPVNCLVIEDARVGVEAARRAGMKCVAVCTTHKAEELRDAGKVVQTLDDLTIGDVQILFA